MSSYEDYHERSRSYDSTRRPVGLRLIHEIIEQQAGVFGAVTLLDAGCGTGNYLHALAGRIHRGIGVDLNEGMLDQARRKLGAAPHVALHRAGLESLPVASAAVHVVTCTQVLHHLDGPSAGRGFPMVRAALAELHRVLADGGALVINTSSHAQCRDGFWWAALIAEAMERLLPRFPDVVELESLLNAAGFDVVASFALRDEVLQGQAYFDPTGPLDADWRQGDSTWALVGDAELRAALERIRAMKRAGTLASWFEERERIRRRIGQTTHIVARKRA